MKTTLLGARIRRTILLTLVPIPIIYSLIVVPHLQPANETQETQSGNALPDSGEELRKLISDSRNTYREIEKLASALPAAQGGDQAAIERQLVSRALQFLKLIGETVESLLEEESRGAEVVLLRSQIEEAMQQAAPALWNDLNKHQRTIAELSVENSGLTASELSALERQIAEMTGQLDDLAEAFIRHLDLMKRMGLDVANEMASLREFLWYRTEVTAGQIRLAQDRQAGLAARLDLLVGDSELTNQLQVTKARLEHLVESLSRYVKVMNELEIETADFQKLLVETAGQSSIAVLDATVAVGLFQDWMEQAGEWALEALPGVILKFLSFLLILLAFWALAKFARKVVRLSVASSKLDFSHLLQNMAVSVVSKGILLIGFLVGLSQLGIEVGPMLAGIGILGFIVGFALQDSLANFAAGVMILIYRPFDVEDLVEVSGALGTVNDMSFVSTTILTIDNQTLVVPNGKIWGDVIRNLTAEKIRRVDLVFGISYDDDVPKAEKVLRSILKEHKLVLEDPEPVVKLHNLGDSSVDFVVRPWCQTNNYWDVLWDVTREVKLRFDQEKISIPFPQRDVHIYTETVSGERT